MHYFIKNSACYVLRFLFYLSVKFRDDIYIYIFLFNQKKNLKNRLILSRCIMIN